MYKSSEKRFVYTTEQQHLHNCEMRMRGLEVEIKSGKPYEADLERVLAAREDILSRMPEAELAAMVAHETRVLTPAERAAEAKALAEQMAENRDKPSI